VNPTAGKLTPFEEHQLKDIGRKARTQYAIMGFRFISISLAVVPRSEKTTVQYATQSLLGGCGPQADHERTWDRSLSLITSGAQ